MKGMMKYIGIVKYILLLILLAFIFFLQKGEGVSLAPMETVAGAVTKAVDMERLSLGDNRMLRRLYGIQAGDYENVVLYVSGSNMEVEEILIVKLRDLDQAETVKEAAEARVKKQLKSFEGYGPEQCSLLKSHVLDVRGNYILFLVNEKAAEAEKAFRKSLS